RWERGLVERADVDVPLCEQRRRATPTVEGEGPLERARHLVEREGVSVGHAARIERTHPNRACRDGRTAPWEEAVRLVRPDGIAGSSPRNRDQIVVPKNGSRARTNWSRLVAKSLPSPKTGPENRAARFPPAVHNWVIGGPKTLGEEPRRLFVLWNVGQSAGPGP